MDNEAYLYHSAARKGFFAVWKENHGDKPAQRSYPLSKLDEALQKSDGAPNTYISQNEFFMPNRQEKSLSRLCVTFLDLDTYRSKDYSGYSHYQMVGLIHAHCDDNRIPQPSAIISSGRGLYLKWYYNDPVSWKALPQWKAMQACLLKKFQAFGADNRAIDASRVLRIEGTLNTKAGRACQVLWRGSDVYDFDTLFEELLPFSREKFAIERKNAVANRSKKKVTAPIFKNNCHNPNLSVFSSEQLHWDRLHDLRALVRLRGGVSEGHRDNYLFCAAAFASHCYDAYELPREIRYLAEEFAPGMPLAEVDAFMSSVIQRNQKAMKGQKTDFSGKMADPRYTFGNAELVARLELNSGEMETMKTIISAEEAAKRHARRQRERRANAGAKTRMEYLAGAEDAKNLAIELKAQGHDVKDIAARLTRSVSSVRKYLAKLPLTKTFPVKVPDDAGESSKIGQSCGEPRL